MAAGHSATGTGKRNMISFNNKVAIVTGGSAGLGAAFVRQLVQQGARVVLVDVDAAGGAAIAAQTGAEFRHLSVAELAPFQKLVEDVHQAYGSLDLIINNAGISVDGESLEIPLAEWQRVLQVNLFGVIAGSLAAFTVMAKQRSGIILNIASLTGLVLTPMLLPYATGKAGVVTFSRGLAEEAQGFGVRVSVACPGVIQTGILPSHVSKLTPAITPDDAVQRILRQILKGKRIIVFPTYVRLWWLLERVSPHLLGPLRQVIVKRSRERARLRASAQAAQATTEARIP